MKLDSHDAIGSKQNDPGRAQIKMIIVPSNIPVKGRENSGQRSPLMFNFSFRSGCQALPIFPRSRSKRRSRASDPTQCRSISSHRVRRSVGRLATQSFGSPRKRACVGVSGSIGPGDRRGDQPAGSFRAHARSLVDHRRNVIIRPGCANHCAPCRNGSVQALSSLRVVNR